MKKRQYNIISETFQHPLDIKHESNFGFEIPENNYHRKVLNELHHIFEEENKISEKDFSQQDKLKEKCDKIIRDNKIEKIILRFKKSNLRPSYCAECIYSKLYK